MLADIVSQLLKKIYSTQCKFSVFMPYAHFYLSRNVNVWTKTLISAVCWESAVSGLQTQHTQFQTVWIGFLLLRLEFDFYLVLETLHLPPFVSEWKFKVTSTLQTTTNHRLKIFLSYSTLANKWRVPTRKVGLITTPSSATRQHNHWANESECTHGSSRNAN